MAKNQVLCYISLLEMGFLLNKYTCIQTFIFSPLYDGFNTFRALLIKINQKMHGMQPNEMKISHSSQSLRKAFAYDRTLFDPLCDTLMLS